MRGAVVRRSGQRGGGAAADDVGDMAVGDRGFVEQRVMNCAAGLEHLMWQILVVGAG